LLERSIVDRMVGAPERLVFEGAPILVEPLAQSAVARQPCIEEGAWLDTKSICLPLDVREKAELAELHAKAKHYGNMELPFIIAVNMLGPWGYDGVEALFGTEQEYVNAGDRKVQTRKLDNGFWGSAKQPIHTRVSAVLLGCVVPANIPRAEVCLYRNPWAINPLPTEFCTVPTATMQESNLVRTNQHCTIGQLLGLPQDWPG